MLSDTEIALASAKITPEQEFPEERIWYWKKKPWWRKAIRSLCEYFSAFDLMKNHPFSRIKEKIKFSVELINTHRWPLQILDQGYAISCNLCHRLLMKEQWKKSHKSLGRIQKVKSYSQVMYCDENVRPISPLVLIVDVESDVKMAIVVPINTITRKSPAIRHRKRVVESKCLNQLAAVTWPELPDGATLSTSWPSWMYITDHTCALPGSNR